MDKATCAEPGCPKASHARGLCGAHYSKHYKLGTLPPLPAKPTGCISEGCQERHYLREMCRYHYEKWREAQAPECSAEGCEKGVRSKGLCGAHYQVFRREAQAECADPDCSDKANAGGLCGKHYRRARVAANPACSAGWCDRNAVHQGLCSTHHSQVWRLGALIPDEFDCGVCGGRFRRSEWRLQGSALRCPRCQVKAGTVHRWCMTVDELAQRDGTDCAICREPVDMSLRRPDLMSPSVEHVIPRALGGEDVPENLALAHLLCNMRKGARAA